MPPNLGGKHGIGDSGQPASASRTPVARGHHAVKVPLWNVSSHQRSSDSPSDLAPGSRCAAVPPHRRWILYRWSNHRTARSGSHYSAAPGSSGARLASRGCTVCWSWRASASRSRSSRPGSRPCAGFWQTDASVGLFSLHRSHPRSRYLPPFPAEDRKKRCITIKH